MWVGWQMILIIRSQLLPKLMRRELELPALKWGGLMLKSVPMSCWYKPLYDTYLAKTQTLHCKQTHSWNSSAAIPKSHIWITNFSVAITLSTLAGMDEGVVCVSVVLASLCQQNWAVREAQTQATLPREYTNPWVSLPLQSCVGRTGMQRNRVRRTQS